MENTTMKNNIAASMDRHIGLSLLTFALALALLGCAGSKPSVTDSRDGKRYKTVKIGEQTWMAENLNYSAIGSKCYGEGGSVCISMKGSNCDKKAVLPSNEVQSNCKQYGRLYEWSLAMKACPEGWHLPSKDEWETLTSYIEKENNCSECAGKHLKAKSGWPWDYNKSKSGNGTDAYGFTALPSGWRMPEDNPSGSVLSDFNGGGERGFWWSSTKINEYTSSLFNIDFDKTEFRDESSDFFNSVRCVKD